MEDSLLGADEAAPVALLTEPADGVPPLITTAEALTAAAFGLDEAQRRGLQTIPPNGPLPVTVPGAASGR